MAGESGEFELIVDGTEFRFGHDEMTLYNFAGEAALYDHVYLGFADDGTGAYVFKTDPEQAEMYEILRGYVLEHDLPMLLNWLYPDEKDIQRYNARVAATAEEFPDFFTEG